MNHYQFTCHITPSDFRDQLRASYQMDKPLGLLAYDMLGLKSGTYCGMKENRFWLFRTERLFFSPKRHFRGIMQYDSQKQIMLITGKFVYTAWYLVFAALLFCFLLFSDTDVAIPRVRLAIISAVITAAFSLLSILFGNLLGKKREEQIIEEFKTIFKVKEEDLL